MTPPARVLLAWLAVAASAAGLCSCATTSDDALETSLAALGSAASRPQPPTSGSVQSHRCRGNWRASLRPRGSLPAPGRMPAGTWMRKIQDRGHLVAGVDQNTLRLAYLNPLSGQLAGFEIDILRQVSTAIFGRPDRIAFRAISSDERVAVIQKRSVDIVANLMTITCARSKSVAFTSVYYVSAQRVLVPKHSSARSVDDLAGQPVCATRTSTSIEHLMQHTEVRPYPVRLRTDCLIALQEGRVAAISTDDAILYGFTEQDPQTKLVGPRLRAEHWAMAINKAHPEFVRFVNGVLARMRRDGTWASIHERWLRDVTRQPAPRPPRAHYRD